MIILANRNHSAQGTQGQVRAALSLLYRKAAVIDQGYGADRGSADRGSADRVADGNNNNNNVQSMYFRYITSQK